MKRLGLDYAALSAANPRLVCCSISGFGQDGPYAQLPALDVVVQGMGGVMSYTGEPGGPPVRPGVSIGDIAAGLFAAIGILSALMERAVSGKGQYVDISMLDCQIAIQEHAFSRYLNAGDIPKPLGTRHPIFTPFQAFEAKDGWVVVAIVGGRNDQWPLFCATIGRLDLIDVPEYKDGHSRTQHYERLEPELSKAFKEKTVGEWIKAFQAVEIACGPVNTVDQVVRDPQVVARQMIVEAKGETGQVYRLLNTPVRLSRTPGAVERISPGLGEHTAEVLGEWLGLGAAEVEALRQAGVV